MFISNHFNRSFWFYYINLSPFPYIDIWGLLCIPFRLDYCRQRNSLTNNAMKKSVAFNSYPREFLRTRLSDNPEIWYLHVDISPSPFLTFSELKTLSSHPSEHLGITEIESEPSKLQEAKSFSQFFPWNIRQIKSLKFLFYLYSALRFLVQNFFSLTWIVI